MRDFSVLPGVVLAAGASTRLRGGRAKQLVVLDGKTLLRRAAEAAVAAAGEGTPVIVVLGHRAEECAAELTGLTAVRTVWAERWAAGMGASLKAGLGAVLSVAPGAAGIVVSLCDQPRVTAADLGTLRRTARDAGGGSVTVVAAEYGGGPGVPAFFGREVFGDVQRLDDAAGAKGLMLRQEAAGRLVRVPMPAAAVDVDTPADLARLRVG